jgi:hypothetical protein
MSTIAATQQNLYASIIAATSAANKARTENTSTGSGNASGTSAANSTSVSVSQQAQNLAATSQASSSSSGSYDFTNMTPNQIRKLSQELFESGKINSQQSLSLMTIGFVGRFPATKDYTPPTDADIARINNTPINCVQYCKDRISFLESVGQTADPQYGYESWKGLLAFMQNTTSGGAA